MSKLNEMFEKIPALKELDSKEKATVPEMIKSLGCKVTPSPYNFVPELDSIFAGQDVLSQQCLQKERRLYERQKDLSLQLAYTEEALKQNSNENISTYLEINQGFTLMRMLKIEEYRKSNILQNFGGPVQAAVNCEEKRGITLFGADLSTRIVSAHLATHILVQSRKRKADRTFPKHYQKRNSFKK